MKKQTTLTNNFRFDHPLSDLSIIKLGDKKKMATLRQTAKKYEGKTTKNIAELKSVSTELDIMEKEFSKSDGEVFKVKVIEVDGETYRVPDMVLKQIKDLLEERPDMTEFKVKKTGEGLKTSYTVIPLG